MKKFIAPTAILMALLLFSTIIFASPDAPTDRDGTTQKEADNLSVATVQVDSTAITWLPKGKSAGLVLTISGPEGIYFSERFEGGVEVTLDLSADGGHKLIDGGYNYELYAVPELSAELQALIANSRNRGDAEALTAVEAALPEPLIQSGYFTIADGKFVTAAKSEFIAAETQPAAPMGEETMGDNELYDQVFADDLVVQASACVGFDCVNGENFGFDTVRLKENNLRIKFDDTSNSGSFPNNDWQLVANDTSNGGANRFSIEDVSGGKTPFTIQAGAPNNALYVTSAGRIGMGTTTPSVQMHMADGNTPSVRLEQNGSSGFASQTWDIAGNETNFFIRDATNGSQLPFRIKPGAPSDSVFIAADGDIGVGTDAPSAPLHVRRVDGTAQLLVENATSSAADRVLFHLKNRGGPQIKLEDTDGEFFWTIGTNEDGFLIMDFSDNDGDPLFVLDDGGTLALAGNDVSTASLRSQIITEQQKEIDDLQVRVAELEALVEKLLRQDEGAETELE